MARAKLSGSLLTRKDAPLPTTLAQQPPAARSTVFRPVAVAISILAVGSVSGLLFLQSGEGKLSTKTTLSAASPTVNEQPASKIVEPKPPAPAKAATVAPTQGAPDAVAGDVAPAPSGKRLPLVMVPAPPPNETPPDDLSARALDTAPIVASADPAAPLGALPPNPKTPAAATRANLPVGVTKSSTAPVEPANQTLNSALLARGDALFVSGDVASARLFYERAANAGDGHAALRLGETYDPAFLARTGLIGSRENASVAAYWYQRASELGVPDGEILLKAIAAETGH
jgi:hypothetical protein